MREKRRLIAGVFCLVLALSGLGLVGRAQPPAPLSAEEIEQASRVNNVVRRAIEQARPAVVLIFVAKQAETGLLPEEVRGVGSGCLIDARGYVITNNHVVADTKAGEVEVILSDRRRFTATEILLDPDTDLAVVRIDPKGQELPAARFGDSDRLQVGDTVLAIGSPFGLEQTVTSGIVSYRGRQTGILGNWGFEDFIQTDAPINRGNSGGPLINLYGEVVGINSNILSPTGVSAGFGFAVPGNRAQEVARQLIENKQVKRGYLGIRMIGLDDLRKVPAERLAALLKNQALLEGIKRIPETVQGVLVDEVLADSPALKAGLKAGDVILSIDEQAMGDSKAVRDYIAARPPESQRSFRLWRDGKEETVTISLGDRAAARAEESERLAQRQRAAPEEDQSSGGLRRPAPAASAKLGIRAGPLTPELAEKYGYPKDTTGIVIDEVQPGSLAAQIPLKERDIILSIDGQKIESVRQLKKIIDEADLEKNALKMEIRNSEGTAVRIIKRGPD